MSDLDPDRLAGLDDLERELVGLGRAIVVGDPPTDLAARVLARVGAASADAQGDEEPVVAAEGGGAVTVESRGDAPQPGPPPADALAAARGRRRERRLPRRRLAWVAAAATVLLLALLPPVRAAVLELLRIGGVVVREEPAPTGTAPGGSSRPAATPSPTTPAGGPEPGSTAVSLTDAQRALGGGLRVPAALGAPGWVALAHEGRVVQLGWARDGRATRLDVFAGSLDWGYVKRVWSSVTPTRVGAHDAVWFGSAHLIEWFDRTGTSHTDQPRVAGPTLSGSSTARGAS